MTPSERFFEEKMKRIFTEKKIVIDIGGGLRLDPERNNRFDTNVQWLRPYLAHVEYKVLDKVPDYHPDIVGDIHALPLPNQSVDAIICVSVLEHIEDPQLAVKEMYRVLKPGGFCYIYAPFLYYYHPMKGYYKDFFRFTRDGLEHLFRDFSSVEYCGVRGALETVVHLLPYPLYRVLRFPAKWLDRLFGKERSNQTSGYNLFAVK